jgi:hypothetical protein
MTKSEAVAKSWDEHRNIEERPSIKCRASR